MFLDTKTRFYIQVEKCSNSTTWKTDQEIQDYIDKNQIQIITINTYYSIQSELSPIGFYINRFYDYELSDYLIVKILVEATEVIFLNETMQYIYEDGQSLSSRLPANLYNPETIFVVQVSLSPKHFR